MNLPVTNSENDFQPTKTDTLPMFLGRTGCSLRAPLGPEMGFKRGGGEKGVRDSAARRLRSGIFSLRSGRRWLSAGARYLLGRTRWEKHGRRPPACVSPWGRPAENSPSALRSFPSFQFVAGKMNANAISPLIVKINKSNA